MVYSGETKPFSDIINCFAIESHNLLLTDLQSVLNSVGEVLEGADGDGFFWWVLAGAVGLCKEWDYHLNVPFGPQCP